jgi:polysaccharide export outer membrane protein
MLSHFPEVAKQMIKRADTMRSRWQMLLVLAAMNLVLLNASAQVAAPQQPVTPTAPHTLRISSGDLLELTVFDTPELSSKLRVNEAGDVSIPIAGALRVSGMTAEEAAATVEDKYRSARILNYPHASVFIAEYATQGVTVAGEVKNPGIYPLLGTHTLLDLVSAAGGVTPIAGKAVTVTHKSDPLHPEVVQIEIKPGSVAANVDVRPGDTIAVSRAGVVYVVGDVAKPGGFLIETNDRLSVLQALALAQGTNRTAAQNKAKLIRKTSTGREEYPLDLKRVLANKSPDLPLNDGDILFVPTSAIKTWQARSVDAAIALTTGLVIYGKL